MLANEQERPDLSNALIRLADVPRVAWLPRRREGKRLGLSTVHRWAQRGLGGVVLRTIRVGGVLCTSERWLWDFFTALSGNASAAPPPSRHSTPCAKRNASIER